MSSPSAAATNTSVETLSAYAPATLSLPTGVLSDAKKGASQTRSSEPHTILSPAAVIVLTMSFSSHFMTSRPGKRASAAPVGTGVMMHAKSQASPMV